MEAGANPNNTGDPQGIARTGSRSFFPSELHGISPVDILHQLGLPDYHNSLDTHDQGDDTQHSMDEIEDLLRSYGTSTPKEGWWHEELEDVEVESSDMETS